MSYGDADTRAGDETRGSWRRGLASAGAIVATLMLVALAAAVAFSNRAREEALSWERHAYDVMLLTRTVDATIARSESALGRFVLDEDQGTSGTIYAREWRRAGHQIGELNRLVRTNEAQRAEVEQLRRLFDARGGELSAAAAGTLSKRGAVGVSLLYQAGLSPTGPELRARLDRIAATERDALRARMRDTTSFGAQADRLTGWLGWLGILIGIGAVILGIVGYHALAERIAARQEADSEASRAALLEDAVTERTRALRDANQRLHAEAAERAAAEAQLRQVQKMEAVGQLTGGIAHDFNNMLSVVVGGLELARRRLDGPRGDVELHLDNAMDGATRAAALTRRLLSFARAEPLLPERVDPTALIRDMLSLIDRTMGDRIVLETDLAEPAWPVWADAGQLENALLNLAVNARDAMDGSGRIVLTVENATLRAGEGTLPAGDYVRIAVADTGAGIAPDILERVFEPFFTTKPIGKGTGLGLSQVFAFARESGGDVGIRSGPGEGTVVTVCLPRAAGGAVRMPAPAPAGVDAGMAQGAMVLVVEDDPRVSRATVASLEELGYHPIACESGADALDIMARTRGIALVVTDVMMPEMTGPELVRLLARRHPDVRILFVTGYVGEAGDAGDLEGYPILRKPFTITALAEAAAAALAPALSGSPPAGTAAAAE